MLHTALTQGKKVGKEYFQCPSNPLTCQWPFLGRFIFNLLINRLVWYELVGKSCLWFKIILIKIHTRNRRHWLHYLEQSNKVSGWLKFPA